MRASTTVSTLVVEIRDHRVTRCLHIEMFKFLPIDPKVLTFKISEFPEICNYDISNN